MIRTIALIVATMSVGTALAQNDAKDAACLAACRQTAAACLAPWETKLGALRRAQVNQCLQDQGKCNAACLPRSK